MSKDLLTISEEELRRMIGFWSFPVLKNIIELCYEFKRKNYKNAPMEVLQDIERKETIVLREIQERGYNTKGSDFNDWHRKLRNKASKIYIVKK